MSANSNVAYLGLVFPEVPQPVLDLAVFCSNNDLDKAMDGLLRYSESVPANDSKKRKSAADTSFTPEKKGKGSEEEEKVKLFIINEKNESMKIQICVSTTMGYLAEKLKKYAQFSTFDQMWHWCVKEVEGGKTQIFRTKLEINKTAADYKELWKHGNIIRWYSSNTSKNAFKITVRTFEDGTFTLGVERTDTISTVKGLIHHIYGLPPNAQRLIFGSKELNENLTLAEYNITKEATIHLKERTKA